MKLHYLGAAALAIPVCLAAVEHTGAWQKTFQVGGADRKLIIENINGNIVVTGDAASGIRVTVRERYSAPSQAELDEARRELRLESEQTGNTVRLYLDGPFRDRDRWRERRRMHFDFRHDFEVHVPRDIALELKTINGGELRAERTRGEFHLRNINGKVQLLDAAGWGDVETLNGSVTVTFVENPSQPSRFKSLNGHVEVAFQPNLSADLRLKSMNGDAYTDFDFVPAASAVHVSRTDGPTRLKLENARAIRIGAGGVQHSLETLNGNIKITKYGK